MSCQRLIRVIDTALIEITRELQQWKLKGETQHTLESIQRRAAALSRDAADLRDAATEHLLRLEEQRAPQLFDQAPAGGS
jgi:hypothetical protein